MVHADKRRGKTHARILYWFRTPPGVRVGRAALDEEAIRLIESSNPGVAFDWPRMLKGADTPPPPRPQPVERRAKPRVRELPRREEPPAPLSATAAGSTAIPDPPVSAVRAPEPEAPEPGPPRDGPPAAASTRLGAEGLARLRARHAEVLARIAEKIQEPERREQLKADAERLNPDTWVTDADVAAGLEGYEAAFEALRSVIGTRRRRRRRRPADDAGPGPHGSPGAEPPADDE